MSKFLTDNMFPSLKGTWGNLEDLNLYSAILLEEITGGNLIDPAKQIGLINLIHTIKNVDYTYGGYLEDRKDLFREHYHKPGHTIHLGVDFNVPEDTPVHIPVDCKLVDYDNDPDQFGGWGGWMIFQAENGLYYILGHLKHRCYSLACKDRPSFKAGQYIGEVAGPEQNGNWFPHLHLQCMKKWVTRTHTLRSPMFDGYSHRYDEIETDFPHPTKL
jgi:hypothetical protein